MIFEFEEYQELESEGRYEQAIPFAKELLQLAEKEVGTENKHFSVALNILAGLYAGPRLLRRSRSKSISTHSPEKTQSRRRVDIEGGVL